MPYTIVFKTSITQDLSAASAKTALDALGIVGSLQDRSDEIRYISSPQEGEIGIEMLRLLAKEEQEELPARAKSLGPMREWWMYPLFMRSKGPRSRRLPDPAR